MIKKRETWLDSLKGFGIILVVLGHCFPPERALTNYLYSFHIALFFYISGYLLNNNFPNSFKEFFRRKFSRLILPYFIYGLFTYLIWLFIGRNYGVNKELSISSWKPLLGILYGNGIDNFLVFNISLWFLPALFSTLMLYYIVKKMSNNHKIKEFIYVVFLITFSLINSKLALPRLPWGIDIAFIALYFIYLGQYSKNILLYVQKRSKVSILLMSMLLILFAYYLSKLNNGVSFNSHSYGNPFLFFLSASISIFAYALLIKLLDNKLLQFLGKISLRILALHIFTFSLISAFIQYIIHSNYAEFKVTLLGRITYFLAAILIISIYSILIDKISLFIKKRQEN